MLVVHDPELHNVRVLPTYDFLRDDPRYRAWEANLPWVKNSRRTVNGERETGTETGTGDGGDGAGARVTPHPERSEDPVSCLGV